MGWMRVEDGVALVQSATAADTTSSVDSQHEHQQHAHLALN